MRIPIVLLAGLLTFSHGFAADNVIRLSQPLHLEVPKGSAEPAKATAAGDKGDKEVAKTDTTAGAISAKAGKAASANDNVMMESDDDAQEKLAEKIKARLAALRERQAAQAATAKMAPKVKPKEKNAEVQLAAAVKHWSYDGEEGPEHWGKLNTAWAQCASGKRQSPIDIHDGIKVDLEPIKFDYQPVHFKVTDNGHTIQVDLEPGNRITLTGHSYELLQFHFHRPSEERINGKGFPMVVHLVHKDDEGKLAVVALLADEGVANSIIQNVWNNLPLEKTLPVVPTGTIDVSQLLPMARDYYTYMGSLTTPPCSEGVLWMVMKQPIKMSASQIGIFARLYPMNARPLQLSQERMIKESN
jgi:carbonic anhydrase